MEESSHERQMFGVKEMMLCVLAKMVMIMVGQHYSEEFSYTLYPIYIGHTQFVESRVQHAKISPAYCFLSKVMLRCRSQVGVVGRTANRRAESRWGVVSDLPLMIHNWESGMDRGTRTSECEDGGEFVHHAFVPATSLC